MALPVAAGERIPMVISASHDVKSKEGFLSIAGKLNSNLDGKITLPTAGDAVISLIGSHRYASRLCSSRRPRGCPYCVPSKCGSGTELHRAYWVVLDTGPVSCVVPPHDREEHVDELHHDSAECLVEQTFARSAQQSRDVRGSTAPQSCHVAIAYAP